MKISILIFVLIVFSSLISGCSDNKFVGNEITKGGSCDYESYSGVLTIEEVRFNREASTAKVYSVDYEFEADSLNAPAFIKPAREKTELTKGQILKGEVKPGKQFRAKVKYIVNGTCAPGPYLDDFEEWQ